MNGMIFAPSATPEPIVEKRTEAIFTVMQTLEIKERIAVIGGEVYNGNINEANQFILNQIQEWSKIMRDRNISIN
jgi:tripartite-type tricarboxylate transporter receptor subunit TctC